jgi:hypothetical protein
MKLQQSLFKNIIIISLMFFTVSCASTKNQITGFEKFVYHSTRCFGTCPSLSLEVNADKTARVQRQFFESRGKEQAENSGSFQGTLTNKQFNILMKAIKASNYESLKFPDIDCCDAPIVTIIVYANGKKTYLKSMMPPQEASELILFLQDYTSKIQLPTTTEKFEIEQ